jgi:membrane protein DedA with SNARE-associated domain
MRTSSKTEYAKFAAIAAGAAVVFFLMSQIYGFFDLPAKEEIIAWAQAYYERYGYSVVFVGALVEGMLLINWYLPGSIVIVLGVVFAGQDPAKASFMVLLIILGFYISALVNYVLGRYGWYRVLTALGLDAPLLKVKTQVEKRGLPILFSTYIHPNLGALTATSAGILHLPFAKFALYSAIAIIAWNSMWGVVVYLVGPAFLQLVGMPMIMFVLAAWLVYLAFQYKYKKPDQPSIP